MVDILLLGSSPVSLLIQCNVMCVCQVKECLVVMADTLLIGSSPLSLLIQCNVISVFVKLRSALLWQILYF